MIQNKHVIIKNIYYMLAYAFKDLKQSNYEEVASEDFEYIHDLFAKILSLGITRQLKQGLYKEYIVKEDDLLTLRGKINFPETINHQMRQKRVLACEFDELSENNIYNQILKTTVLLLLREASVQFEIKNNLKKSILFFANIDEINLSLVRWNQLRFSKNNQRYRMLIAICQLIYEGLIITTDSGTIKVAHFLDEQRMCRLYEKFILEFYRAEMPMLNANASWIDWQVTDGDDALLPGLHTDIMLTDKEGKKTLIIDAKYYSKTTQVQHNKRSLHSSNMFQIFTYVKNKDVGNTGNVAGMLLYAKTDEEIVPDADVIISGNKISAKTLDLNCDFVTIKAQLVGIANEYFEIPN